MTPMSGACDRGSDGLFARAQAGDQEAWKTLFDTCYPKVVRVVRRKMHSPMIRSLYDSTDFASDVWKSLAAKSDKYEFANVNALMAFLTQAARQKVDAEYRRLLAQKRQEGLKVSFEDAGGRVTEPQAVAPSPSQEAVGREIAELIFTDLSPEERQIVELKRDGCSNDEVTDRTGLNLRKVQRILKSLHDSRWLNWGR